MSVTKSYNKNNNTYYAYDTQYEWDEVQQKRVQIKRCIGKFDAVPGDIIPTGKRGKKSTAPTYPKAEASKKQSGSDYRNEVDSLAVKLRDVSDSYESRGRELAEISAEMNNLLLREQNPMTTRNGLIILTT